jgi:hypothetical protein
MRHSVSTWDNNILTISFCECATLYIACCMTSFGPLICHLHLHSLHPLPPGVDILRTGYHHHGPYRDYLLPYMLCGANVFRCF